MFWANGQIRRCLGLLDRSGDVCAGGWVERVFLYFLFCFWVVADEEMFGADGLG